MAKIRENVFFCGRRFEMDEEGRLVPLTPSELAYRGKYGEDTVTVRLPVSLGWITFSVSSVWIRA